MMKQKKKACGNAERKCVIQASSVRFDELTKNAESVESMTSDSFEIENGDADTPMQADADTPR